MATGDILSCEVLATGWQAKIVIAGFVDGGAYDFGDVDTDVNNAKVKLTVTSEGYSTSGTLSTITRTVFGTRVVQKAYPDHASPQETEADGNLEIVIALSDYLYNDDCDGGAGTSGTDPVVNIAAGWYTDSGAGGSSAGSNAAIDLSVTNSSTVDYPKVVARWAVVPYQRFTGTFDLECVAFHRFAAGGKPVACVKFTATDGANTENVVATAMSKSAQADSLPCYVGQIDAADYSDNVVVTCNFIAYPWVGDADSVRDSSGGTSPELALCPLPLLADSDDDYGVTVSCVNTSTGNDSTGVASNSLATARANPCATIRAALSKIATYNNTNYSRNNANAGIIYLQSNNHSWGDGTGSATTDNVWVTVTRDPDVAKASACIVGNPNGTVVTARTCIRDITFVPTGFIVRGASTRILWLDQVHNEPASQLSTHTTWGHLLTFNTHCTADKHDAPWANYSTGNVAALVRGCSALNAVSVGATDYYPRALLTTTIDHNGKAGALIELKQENQIVAYSRSLRNSITTSHPVWATAGGGDIAVICNLVEKTGGTTTVSMIYGDGDIVPCNNVLVAHNTFAGERSNIGYNEGTANTARSNFSLKYNSLEYFATKHDVFKTDGDRIGAWSVTYGVGWVGNNSERDTTSFQPYYFGVRGTLQESAGYVDDQSKTVNGAGGGDYTPDTGSVLIGKIATTADLVIPWDINGDLYAAGSSAGAIAVPAVAGQTVSESITEGVVFADATAAAITAAAAIAEGLAAGDQWAADVTAAAATIDGIVAGDQTAAVALAAVAISDGTRLGDAILAAITARGATTDGIVAADTSDATAAAIAAALDGISAGDSASLVVLSALISEALAEGTVYGDAFAAAVTGAGGAADGARLGDQLTAAARVVAAHAEGLRIGDAFAASLRRSLVIGEAIVYSDTAAPRVVVQAGTNNRFVFGDFFDARVVSAAAVAEGALLGGSLALGSVEAGLVLAAIRIMAATAASLNARASVAAAADLSPAVTGTAEINDYQ